MTLRHMRLLSARVGPGSTSVGPPPIAEPFLPACTHRDQRTSNLPAMAKTFPPRQVDAPTLNTSAESGSLFKVLSVEVFNLRCISTNVVEMHCTLYK